MTTRQDWADDLLIFGDWPGSAEKVLGIVAWGVAEGSEALWNPLDTTEPAPGATNYNSAGVKNYPSLQVGLEAVYATLHNGHYAPILACLADPTGSSAMALAAAVGRTPWGTGNFSPIVERVKADPALYYAQEVAGGGAPPVTPPDPEPPPSPSEEDEMEPFVAASASREIVVWPSGPATLLTTPEDGSILAAQPQPFVVKTGFSESFISACLARPA